MNEFQPFASHSNRLAPIPRLQPGQLLPPDLEIQSLLGCHGGANIYKALSGPIPMTLIEVTEQDQAHPSYDEMFEMLVPNMPSFFWINDRAYALYRGSDFVTLRETVLNCEEDFLTSFLHRLIELSVRLDSLNIDVSHLGPDDVVIVNGNPLFLIYPVKNESPSDLDGFLHRLISHVLFTCVLPKVTRNLQTPLNCLMLSSDLEQILTHYLNDGDSKPLRVFLRDRYAEPAAYWDLFGQIHPGHVRGHNEDALAWRLEHSFSFQRTLQTCFIAVCDGMGGHKKGEQASHLALDTFIGTLTGHLTGDFPSNNPQLGALVLTAFDQASEAVRTTFSQYSKREKPGSTMVAGLVHGRQLFLGNCGDSRAYLYTKNQLHQITVDHSLAQLYRQQGATSESENPAHDSHVITSFIGIESRSLQRDLYVVHLPVGAKLLLCSDGLTDMVKPDEISQILKASPTSYHANQRLLQAALDNGGHDNISIITMFDRNEEVGPAPGNIEPVNLSAESEDHEESYE